MPFETADRINLDTILGNTASTGQILQDVIAILRNQTAGHQSLLNQIIALEASQAAAAAQQTTISQVVTDIVAVQTNILTLVEALNASVATDSGQRTIEVQLNKILDLLNGVFRPPSPPVAIRLGLPTIIDKTTGEVMSTNFALQDTQVAHFPILSTTAAGAFVPDPAGDTYTATTTDPTGSWTVVVGVDASGNPEVVATPMVQNNSTPVPVEVSDTAGLTVFDFTLTVSANPTPKNIVLGAPTFTTQPEPTTPGPG